VTPASKPVPPRNSGGARPGRARQAHSFLRPRRPVALAGPRSAGRGALDIQDRKRSTKYAGSSTTRSASTSPHGLTRLSAPARHSTTRFAPYEEQRRLSCRRPGTELTGCRTPDAVVRTDDARFHSRAEFTGREWTTSRGSGRHRRGRSGASTRRAQRRRRAVDRIKRIKRQLCGRGLGPG
jgi:hypothetical protein